MPEALYAPLPEDLFGVQEGGLWDLVFDHSTAKPGEEALAVAAKFERLVTDQMRAYADATSSLRGGQQGWQSIDSAPKDGRTLLLGWFNSHGKWRTTRGMWITQEYIDEYFEDPDMFSPGWVETTVEDDDGKCYSISPTHFMALPSPPPSTHPQETQP